MGERWPPRGRGPEGSVLSNPLAILYAVSSYQLGENSKSMKILLCQYWQIRNRWSMLGPSWIENHYKKLQNKWKCAKKACNTKFIQCQLHSVSGHARVIFRNSFSDYSCQSWSLVLTFNLPSSLTFEEWLKIVWSVKCNIILNCQTRHLAHLYNIVTKWIFIEISP